MKPITQNGSIRVAFGKRSKVRDFTLGFLVTLGFLSHLFSVYLNAPAQIAWLLSPLFFLATIFIFRRFPVGLPSIFVYLFFLFWFVVAIFSAFASQSFSALIQLGSYVLLPISFFLVGFFGDRRLLNGVFFRLFVALFAFTLLERIAFFSGSSGFGVASLSFQLRSFQLEPGGEPFVGRATGFFGNPNELGFVSGGMAFLLFFLSLREGAIRVLPLFFGLVLCFLSGSRGSLLAFLLAFLLVLPFLFSLKRYSFLLTFGFCVVLPAIVFGFGHLLPNSFNIRFFDFSNVVSSGSVQGRLEFWEGVFGLQSLVFGTLVSPESVLGHAVDNFFLRVLAQTGLFGFAITTVGSLLLLCLSTSVSVRAYRVSLVGFFSFSIINSFTMLGYLSPAASVVFWTMVGQSLNCRVALARR